MLAAYEQHGWICKSNSILDQYNNKNHEWKKTKSAILDQLKIHTTPWNHTFNRSIIGKLTDLTFHI